MTHGQILKKAIEKAVKNGWKPPIDKDKIYLGIKEIPIYGLGFFYRPKYKKITLEQSTTATIVDYSHFLFSHDFAKAFWGNQLLCYDCGEPVKTPILLTANNAQVVIGTGQCSCSRQFENNEEAWEYHLQQMVLEDDPISYLKKFL